MPNSKKECVFCGDEADALFGKRSGLCKRCEKKLVNAMLDDIMEGISQRTVSSLAREDL